MKPSSTDFRKSLSGLLHRHDPRKIFDAFVRLGACAVSCQTREAEYLEEAKRWTVEELTVFGQALGHLVREMETRPYEDVLGVFYMDWALSHSSAQWGGEFHTPKPICDLLARMTFTPGSMPAEGPINVCEPACGGGAMILAAAHACPPEMRHRLRFHATDLNRTACDMTFINTTLWGVPCRVYHGDTIRMKFYGAWSNLHFICPWLPLAARLGTEEAKTQGQFTQVEVVRLHEAVAARQQTFAFAFETEKEAA